MQRFGRRDVKANRGASGNQRSSSSNNVRTIHRSKEKVANYRKLVVYHHPKKRKLVVYVDTPKQRCSTRLELDKDNATVDEVKIKVLKQKGVEIPKGETVLSYNGSVLSDGNKKLLHYKIRKEWTTLHLDWKLPQGEEDDSSDDEDDDDEEYYY